MIGFTVPCLIYVPSIKKKNKINKIRGRIGLECFTDGLKTPRE